MSSAIRVRGLLLSFFVYIFKSVSDALETNSDMRTRCHDLGQDAVTAGSGQWALIIKCQYVWLLWCFECST